MSWRYGQFELHPGGVRWAMAVVIMLAVAAAAQTWIGWWWGVGMVGVVSAQLMFRVGWLWLCLAAERRARLSSGKVMTEPGVGWYVAWIILVAMIQQEFVAAGVLQWRTAWPHQPLAPEVFLGVLLTLVPGFALWAQTSTQPEQTLWQEHLWIWPCSVGWMLSGWVLAPWMHAGFEGWWSLGLVGFNLWLMVDVARRRWDGWREN